MNQQFTYLYINIFTVLIPFVFSFHRNILFYKQWRYLFPAIAITALVFIAWDMIFTHLGIWYFNPEMVLGIEAGNLPLEEVLFFIAIPYSCVFLYEVLLQKIKHEKLIKAGNFPFYLLIAFLIITLIVFKSKLYTFVTFTALLFYLILIKLFLKVKYLNLAFLSYSILLLPFFIVNGFLTGMFTAEPVVLYNNNENMGIRIGTIPLEDAFYGLLLFLMNVSLYELFKKTLNHGN